MNISTDNYTWHVTEIRFCINYPIVVNLPLGRFGRRWDDDIKTDLQEVGLAAWNGLVWLRIDRWQTLVNALMNLQVPYNAGGFLTI